jgi:hypothetical protein
LWTLKGLLYYIKPTTVRRISGLGKNPGNLKKPMGMGKTGFYREKWEKREKLSFFKIHV